MKTSLTIYSAISFTPFQDDTGVSYESYIESQIKISSSYVLLALQLSTSFPPDKFILVTNEPYLFLTIAQRYTNKFPSIQYCSFNFLLDPDTPYRLAHYKIDIWKHISEFCPTTHACLLDLDIFASDRSYEHLLSFTDSSVDIFFYDQYSQQVRSYGEEVILRDISLLSNHTQHVWAGGEFLLGTKDSFGVLFSHSRTIRDKYISLIPELRHVGDEAILTSSLIASSDLLSLNSINHLSILNRVFLARLLKGSRRQSFFDLFGFPLLHLPSSKAILGSFIYFLIPKFLKRLFLYVYMLFSVLILRFLPCR